MATLLEGEKISGEVIEAVLKEYEKKTNARIVPPNIAALARFHETERGRIFGRKEDGEIDEVSLILMQIRCLKRDIFEGLDKNDKICFL